MVTQKLFRPYCKHKLDTILRLLHIYMTIIHQAKNTYIIQDCIRYWCSQILVNINHDNFCTSHQTSHSFVLALAAKDGTNNSFQNTWCTLEVKWICSETQLWFRGHVVLFGRGSSLWGDLIMRLHTYYSLSKKINQMLKVEKSLLLRVRILLGGYSIVLALNWEGMTVLI